jgi:hypothetical protein
MDIAPIFQTCVKGLGLIGSALATRPCLLQRLVPRSIIRVAMKPTNWFPFQACAFVLLFPAAALFGSTTTHSKFVGTYLSQPLEDAKVGPSMDLSLGSDGSATVTEDPGNGTTTLFGHWVDSGTQVMVTFDAVEGKPAEPPMVFQPGHDGLQAVSWNHVTWGKTNPPPMKNRSKVKERLTHNKSMD